VETKVEWCIKKWIRIKYEGGLLLIGGSADNGTYSSVHSFLSDCNENEPQGLYYLASLDARMYRSFSISIVVSKGRVCNALVGCLCTYTSKDTTLATDFTCLTCNLSLCGEDAQAPVLAISMMAVPRSRQSLSWVPTSKPSHLDEERSQRNITTCVDVAHYTRNDSAAVSSSWLEISLRYLPAVQEVQFSLSRVSSMIQPSTARNPSPSPLSMTNERRIAPSITTAASIGCRQPWTRELLPTRMPSAGPSGHHFYSSHSPVRKTAPTTYPTLSPTPLSPLFTCTSWMNQTVWQQLYSLPNSNHNTTRSYQSVRIFAVIRVDSLRYVGKRGAAMYQRSSSRHPSRCALSFEVGNPVNIECPTIELANGADLLDVSVEVQAIVFSDGSKAMSPSSRRGKLSWVLACALLGVLATFLLLCHLLSVRTRCACCGRAEAAYSPIVS
jgi:hypothetical protein